MFRYHKVIHVLLFFTTLTGYAGCRKSPVWQSQTRSYHPGNYHFLLHHDTSGMLIHQELNLSNDSVYQLLLKDSTVADCNLEAPLGWLLRPGDTLSCLYERYDKNICPAFIRLMHHRYCLINSRGEVLFDSERIALDTLHIKSYQAFLQMSQEPKGRYEIVLMWDKLISDSLYHYVERVCLGYLMVADSISQSRYGCSLSMLNHSEMKEIIIQFPFKLTLPFASRRSLYEILPVPFKSDL